MKTLIEEAEDRENRARRHIALLEARHNNRLICISWQTDVMRTPALNYFHAECLLRRPQFKSEAIAQGTWRELSEDEVGSEAKCSHCERKLREPCQND